MKKGYDMKKRLVATAVLMAAIVAGSTGAVLAGHRPGGEFGGPPPGMGFRADGFEERMAKILRLSETQQSQIKAVFDSERETVKPLFDKMQKSRAQIQLLVETPAFDEAAVRAAAHAQAAIETELIVSRARVENRIHGLLTQEQRELLKNLRP